jgi:hypothetical protein
VLAGIALYVLQIHIKWHLSKDLIFSVFFSPPTFAAALFIIWENFKKDLPIIAVLASAGVMPRRPSSPSKMMPAAAETSAQARCRSSHGTLGYLK